TILYSLYTTLYLTLILKQPTRYTNPCINMLCAAFLGFEVVTAMIFTLLRCNFIHLWQSIVWKCV
ncbi:MAG: hypothetical protein KAJ69_01350, partial [Thermoplasmatales archaeon]|nr:hypothetical protein [Thermoplasmatales archaeon]